MRPRRYPTAMEIERVAEILDRSPSTVHDIALELRMDRRYVHKALVALGWQRRAAGTRNGWMVRRCSR